MGNTVTQVAYGDESIRMAGSPPFYLLGACFLNASAREMLNGFAGLKPAGAAKLHWRDMPHRLQKQSLEIIAELEIESVVAVGRPLDGRRQERARRKCLEALLGILNARGTQSLVLESRDSALDHRDLDFVKHARAAHRIGTCTVGHADGKSLPELWLPDQVVGAMGDSLIHAGNWLKWQGQWERVQRRTRAIDVPLA